MPPQLFWAILLVHPPLAPVTLDSLGHAPPEMAARLTTARLAVDSSAAGSAAANPSPDASSPIDVGPDTTLAPTAERVREACKKIHPGSMLRVTFASMARTEGKVSRADDAGLHGLHPTRAAPSTSPSPDVISWASVLQVEKCVGSSGKGAHHGALALGAFGALMGGAIVAGGGIGGGASNAGGGAEVMGGAAIGALTFGALGAGLGALIGTAIPRWHVVY